VPERLDYPTGDLEFGQEVQITRSVATSPAIITYVDSGTVTVSTTAIGLPSLDTSGRDYAYITVETDKVRYRMDTAPTSALGHELVAGDSIELETAEELDSILFIRSGGTDATLQVSYGIRGAA
jgi:hypothetical protein